MLGKLVSVSLGMFLWIDTVQNGWKTFNVFVASDLCNKWIFFSEVDYPILVNGTCQSILEKFKICLLGQGFDRVLRTSLTATK